MAVHNPPYGNIFEIKTPESDKFLDRLYTEQRQRELYKQQQDKMLDDEFARNMSGIRDSDIGDLTKAYGDYKLAYQEGMKKRNISPQEQLEILRKKASIYDILNKSKVEKAQEDNWAKMIPNSKTGVFAEDASDYVRRRRGIPVKQLNPDDDKKLLYPYSVPDFQKYNEMAIGKPTTERRGATTINGLNDETPVYKIGNNPNQMYDTLLNNVVKDNKSTNTIALVNHTFGSEDEKQALMDKYYQRIKDPKFIAAYGDVQPFPQSAQTELGNAVMLQTMRNVVDAPIPEPRIEIKQNPDRRRDVNLQEWLKKNGITYQQALSKIRLNASLQGKGGTNYEVKDLILPDGTTDLTKPLQGINVNNIVTGKSFKSDKTVYNPHTKEITYNDVVDGKEYTVPAQRFRQIINTINTVQDLKVFDNLIESIDKAYAPPPASGNKNRPPLTQFIKQK